MAFFKLLLAIAPIYACASNVAATLTPDAFVPFIPQGNIASTTNPGVDGDRCLFYQNATTGIIMQYSFSSFFGSGHTLGPPIEVVPAAEVLPGTPIASVWLTASQNGGSLRFYFLSRSRVLSEYFFTTTTGWVGGSSCTTCLTQFGFTAAVNTTELYASVNDAGNIAVGHVSPGVPGTISEAVLNINTDNWSLNALS